MSEGKCGYYGLLRLGSRLDQFLVWFANAHEWHPWHWF